MKILLSFLAFLFSISNLTFCQTSGDNNLHHSDSLFALLYSGADDISIVLELYQNDKMLTDDSLIKILGISNKNYLSKDSKRKADPDIQFRRIYFYDQLYRTKCYIHKLIDYSEVQKNDSLLQISFLQELNLHKDLDLLNSSIYQMTFDLLLLHSVTTLETGFFTNNFSKYASAFSNDFKEFENLKHLLDIYLNVKYQKQYFGTGYGKSKLTNGTFGLLPKMTDKELQKVLSDLKVNNANY